MNPGFPIWSLSAALLMVSCEQGDRREAKVFSGEETSNTGAPQRVFSEAQLQEWGYQTTEIAKGRHSIRSLQNYGDAREAFYARFDLSVLAFGSEEEAAGEKTGMDAERESTVLGRDKDYRRYIQEGKTLYVVDATSNYTRLQHQAALMERIKGYFKRMQPQQSGDANAGHASG